MAALCITDRRGGGRHGDESRIHERVVERSARSLSDRRGDDHASDGNVDCEKNFADQDLATDYTDHTDANHHHHLYFRLHLAWHAWCVLVALQAAECCH